MSWPLKKSWKLRWRKARRVAGSQAVFCSAGPEFTGNYPLDGLEIYASITFSPAVLDAAGNLLEKTSALATQNWKFDYRRQLLASALPQRGVEYSMFDVGLSGSFPTCLASIEAGHGLTLEFPAPRGENSPRRRLLQNHSDVGMSGHRRNHEYRSGSP